MKSNGGSDEEVRGKRVGLDPSLTTCQGHDAHMLLIIRKIQLESCGPALTRKNKGRSICSSKKLLHNSVNLSRVLCVRHTTHSALICFCVWYMRYAGGLPGLDYFPSAGSLEPLLCLWKPVPSISSLRSSCGAGASSKFVEKWRTRVM